jgi:hypothetical protein
MPSVTSEDANDNGENRPIAFLPGATCPELRPQLGPLARVGNEVRPPWTMSLSPARCMFSPWVIWIGGVSMATTVVLPAVRHQGGRAAALVPNEKAAKFPWQLRLLSREAYGILYGSRDVFVSPPRLVWSLPSSSRDFSPGPGRNPAATPTSACG